MNSRKSQNARPLLNNTPYGAFDHLLEGCQIIDHHWRYHYVNDAVARHARLEKNQLLGRTMMEVFPGIENTSVFSAIRQCMENGKSQQMENEFDFPDGSKGWHELKIQPVPEGVLLFSLDITERKQTEMALKRNREQLEMVLQGADLGTWDWDYQSGEVKFNDRWAEMLGYVIDEIDTHVRAWKKLVHPYDLPAVMEALNAHLNGRSQSYETEYRLKHKSGRWIWVLDKGKVVKQSAEGKPLRVCGTHLDITERKRAEGERDNLQSQLSNAMEMAHLGHWEYDVAEDLFAFNDHFYKIFGTTAEKMGGYRMSSAEYARHFVHPDDISVVAEEIRKAMETTDPDFRGRLEHRILYADGTIGYISVQHYVVKDAKGKTIKTYGVNQDVTHRKRMESELLKVQKLESVGTLAGGIAHDFNNILTTIIGNISMARIQVKPDDEIFDLLNEAEKASKRAQALTRQLLTLSKGGTPVKETASIKALIEESSLFMLRGSKTGCEFSMAQDLWPAEVDIGQISQVINNIVLNANQAMPEGGIIRITAENLSVDSEHALPLSPGRYIGISIEDEGVGIAEKHLSKVFDPYFTTKHEGSGLGLAVTYSIMKKHDGHITAESRLGVGTTFRIYLPASQETVRKKTETSPIKGKGRVLIMDDEAPLRKMLGIMLRKLGYDPGFAKDGAEAIEIYKGAMASEKPFDVVILDLTVPGGMGGKEAIGELLKIDSEAKVVVSSGYSEDPVLSNFREYGLKGKIPKPFDSLTLSTVLHEVLKGECT